MNHLIPGELVLNPHACNGRNHKKFVDFMAQNYDAHDYNIVVENVKFIVEMFSTQRVRRVRIVQFSMRTEIYKTALVAYKKHADDQDAIHHPHIYKLYKQAREREYEYSLQKPILKRLRTRFEAICKEIGRLDVSIQKSIVNDICASMTRRLSRVRTRPSRSSSELQFDIVTDLRTWNTSISTLFKLRFDGDTFPRINTNTWIVHLNEVFGRLPEDACVQNLKALYEIRKDVGCDRAFLAVKGGTFRTAAGLLNWLNRKEVNRSDPPACCSEAVCKSSPSRVC